jgi:hypothetical protein
VDLQHNTIHVHRSIDRVRGRSGSTKSDRARRVPIEPALLPLLQALQIEAKATGAVFRMPSVGVLSGKLKLYLRRAGVDRGDLFVTDATRKAMTFHDLRATGITWCAVRGDEPLKIMQRAGHADFETTRIYLREAENLAANFGQVFPPLPAELLNPPSRTRGVLVSVLAFRRRPLIVAREIKGFRVELTGIEPLSWPFHKTERGRGLGRELAEIAPESRCRWVPLDTVLFRRSVRSYGNLTATHSRWRSTVDSGTSHARNGPQAPTRAWAACSRLQRSPRPGHLPRSESRAERSTTTRASAFRSDGRMR